MWRGEAAVRERKAAECLGLGSEEENAVLGPRTGSRHPTGKNGCGVF